MGTIKRLLIAHKNQLNHDGTWLVIDGVALILLYFLVRVFLVDFKLGLLFLLIPLTGGSWILTMTSRDVQSRQPKWFRKFQDSKIGQIVLTAATILVLLNIFFFTPNLPE